MTTWSWEKRKRKHPVSAVLCNAKKSSPYKKESELCFKSYHLAHIYTNQSGQTSKVSIDSQNKTITEPAISIVKFWIEVGGIKLSEWH